jgi:hypothetical protein
MKLTHNPALVEGFAHFGFQESALTPIGVVELVCVLLYVIPQTSVFGALLTTAYLGGATATHVRLGEAPTPAVVLGLLIWAGLGLREPRLRALLPLRSKE